MTTNHPLPAEIEEKLKGILDLTRRLNPSIPSPMISEEYARELLHEALAAQKKELIEEVVALSDKIEMGKDETSMQEWRAFKRFRNVLRDKYIL